MKIISIAPMRADLAGGTLDIFPLYVFMGGAVTLNAALTLSSYVSLEDAAGTQIKLISEDLSIEQSAPDIDSLDPAGPLGFIASIVKFYRPGAGVTVTTKNNVPKGSGLGASSTLLIALSHALNTFNKSRLEPEQIIEIGCNLEAEYIQVPAGKQDYYSATYGGLSAIHFTHDGVTRESISSDPEFLDRLDSMFIISFAGEPRFSGSSNWNMFKACIDREGPARENLERIKRTAREMLEALSAQDIPAFTNLLQAEWELRRNIAPGVSTPEIESMMAAAKSSGALASKICGAGGGGCMITLAEPENRESVRKALADNGATLLDCAISRNGVNVVVT